MKYKFKYAFLNLYHHPRGYLMITKLIESGYIPEIVIEEVSPLATKNRNAVLSYLGLTDVKLIDFDALGVEYIKVTNLNEKLSEAKLLSVPLDFIVLGDSRIIKQHIYSIPKIGTINVHPGYLPTVRGNTPYFWALVNKLPQGCSVHFLDEGIDTGDIIRRESFSTKNIHEFGDLLENINELCAKLIVDTFHDFEIKGHISSIKQQALISPAEKSYYFTLAPSYIKNEAFELLKKQNKINKI
jgi:methionyl-tRNA formyltransferase